MIASVVAAIRDCRADFERRQEQKRAELLLAQILLLDLEEADQRDADGERTSTTTRPTRASRKSNGSTSLLVLYVLAYQLVMSPVSVSGYGTELVRARRVW